MKSGNALKIQELSQELKIANQLHLLNTSLIQADNIENYYDKILETAMDIVNANFASIQQFYPQSEKRGVLKLLGQRGFNEHSLKIWDIVYPTSQSTCGLALETGQRVDVADILLCDFMAGSKDQETYLQNGIRAVQSTPLISRTGTMLGMISTHWAEPHVLTDVEKRSLDVLARQAADLIDKKIAEDLLAKANEELLLSNKRKDEFISILSHELRNPLASITMGLSMLDSLQPEGEKTREIKEMINRQCNQLTNLVNDLLDITRITKNSINLNKEHINLTELIENITKDFKHHFDKKEVKLIVNMESTPIYIEADATRINQAIGNILHNAIKFCNVGGNTWVSLSATDEEDQAIISIKDDGIGIDEKNIISIFEPFTQAEKSLERSNGGLGLGLAIVKGLVKLHNGTVEVISQGFGHGCEFIIHLPVLSQKIEYQQEINDKELKESYSLRILVIDDIPDLAKVFKLMLEQLGHEVAIAYNGVDGLAKAREFQPEVIISDLGLPKMNGYDVAENIRNDQCLKNIFLIALSGYALEEDIKKSKQAGFNVHLAKPVDLTILEQVIDEFYHQKEKNDYNNQRVG